MPTFSKEIDAHHTLRASLDSDGTFSLRARSRTPYAEGAYAGAEVEVPPDLAEAVHDALQAALDAVNEPLARRADQAASIAVNHARLMGECK